MCQLRVDSCRHGVGIMRDFGLGTCGLGSV